MAIKRKKRLNNNVYFAEQIVWRGGRWYKKNSDGSLFSGVYKTKIYPEDLPEWYLFGRYYVAHLFYTKRCPYFCTSQPLQAKRNML